ncbi:FAD-dependent monooxygenase [Cupriavidus sp. amp6]|uniref:FAD-dependent monooxygenase n=1 Tax=Cupriavidus sp. amp6 TaxID=388051 RepID=UPI000A052F2B|nr:FAD-dependent monooxygenase [Cupriavidus sp. amp6]
MPLIRLVDAYSNLGGLGADGANSFIRQSAGLQWEDLGFWADWLVVDYRPNNPESEVDMPEAGQICDPARPITMMRRMGRKHVRWEMMLLPGESAEDMARPEKVWSLLDRWVKPSDGMLERAAVYTFRSGVANQWTKGNVILAGDAAHLMPPFLGQGLCSGLRDALSLGWRLDLILSGSATNELLQSYEEERKVHVTTVIERAVALGKVVCITDPIEASKRDAAILSGTAPAIPAFPKLVNGVLHREDDGCLATPAGELAVQGYISSNGKETRLDDATGGGWHVISLDEPADRDLALAQRRVASALGMQFITLGADGGSFADVGNAHRAFMKERGVVALIVRPDFYIFAGVKSVVEVPALLDELGARLCLLPARQDEGGASNKVSYLRT